MASFICNVLQIAAQPKHRRLHAASEAASACAGCFAYVPTVTSHLMKRTSDLCDKAHSAASFYFWSTEELIQSSVLERGDPNAA